MPDIEHKTHRVHRGAEVTFQSSRNAAQTQLEAAGKADGLKREQAIELAQAHIALAQAEAFHELASNLGNVSQALGGLRR